MRIALASQEYPPETAHGGIASQTYAKAQGLTAMGHQVHVISASNSMEKQEYNDGEVQVTRIPGLDQRLPLYTDAARWLTYSAMVAAAISELNRCSRLDLVDFPEWAGEGFIHLLNRTEWNYIPTIIHLHGPLVMFAHAMGWPDTHSELYRIGTMMENTCLRLADGVISSSECSTRWCAQYYGLDENRVSTIHTGVDTRVFYPRSVPKEKRTTIIFVGRIHPDKGVPWLVEAAFLLAKEFTGLKLRIIGLGEPGIMAELRARDAACPGVLELPGFVPHADLPIELSRAHIFAAPSVYEGGPGFVYLEAMACGLPVVACSGSGAAEAVVPEQHGLLVPPRDLDSLCKALRRLLTNPEECRSMGERAHRDVLTKFDSQMCLRRMEAFYESILARSHPGIVGSVA
jgi:glycosyltransferase involved in cell wall biosynthesis